MLRADDTAETFSLVATFPDFALIARLIAASRPGRIMQARRP
jgi:hypothetical protein